MQAENLKRGWLFWVACLVVSHFFFAIVALWLGCDVNWDQLNYHIYAGRYAFEDRSGLDFMPASMQSYMNPLPNLPFYYLAEGLDCSPLVVAAVLSGFAAMAFCLVLVIGLEVWPSSGRRVPWPALFAAVVGVSAPVFLVQVGTSFVDILVACPILLSLLLILRASPGIEGGRRLMAWAGCMAGLALALKLTALPFVFGLLCAIVIGVGLLRGVPWFLLTLAATFLAVDGFWMVRNEVSFGNPFFPFFNAIFRSPLFELHNHAHHRFDGQGVRGLLGLPWYLLADKVRYTEVASPDLRWLSGLLLLVPAVAWRFRMRGRGQPLPYQRRVLLGILAFFIGSVIVWYTLSANARYAIALFVLPGLLMLALARVCGFTARGVIRLLLAVLVLQSTVFWGEGQGRWGGGRWGDRWMEVVVPAKLMEGKFLYLSLQQQSFSALSARLATGSGYVNLIGQQTLENSGPQFERLQQLAKAFGGKIRTLYAPSELDGSRPSQLSGDGRADQQRMLARYGLELVVDDCVAIEFSVSLGQTSVIRSQTRMSVKPAPQGVVFSCGVQLSRRDPLQLDPEDLVLEQVEVICQAFLRGERAVTEWHRTSASRFYADTDVTVRLDSRNRMIKFSNFKGPLGKWSVESLRQVGMREPCEKTP